MLRHYVELFAYFRKQILIATALTGLLCWWVSSLLLSAMPLYVASVTINLQPSEEALMFNSGFLGVTQFNPATIIAQTQIERVLSRPVAERALDILLAKSGGSLPKEPPTAFDRLKASFWRNWNILNYGYFTPPTERQQLVGDIMSATSVELVEGSYIMLLEITHENPAIAASAANALTEAYIEQVRIDFAADAAVVDQTIERAREAKSQELSELLVQKRELERSRGTKNSVEERKLLLAERNEARLRQSQAESAAAIVQEEIDALSGADATKTTATESRDALATELAKLQTRAEENAKALELVEQELATLDASEGELAAVDLSIRENEADLAELQMRRNNIQLAREARMSQVQIINPAQTPVYPFFPKVFVNTIIGTILGFLLSLSPIIVLDVLDQRVRTSEDLRQIAGLRALPGVTRRLSRNVRGFMDRGAAPGGQLRAFSEAMARAIITAGRRRWPERRIMVTAFGTDDDIERLKDTIEAALRVSAPKTSTGEDIEVVALPRATQVSDWKLLRYDLIVVGLRAGTVTDDEVKRVADVEGGGTVETLLTVIQ